MPLKHLTAIQRYISENEYLHRNGIAQVVYDIYERKPDCSLEEFTNEVLKIRHDFFRINKIDRRMFAADIYGILGTIRQESKPVMVPVNPSGAGRKIPSSSTSMDGSKSRDSERAMLRDFSAELIGAAYVGIVLWVSSQLGMLDIVFLVFLVGVPGLLCLFYSRRRRRK